ncbi:MAG TPA: hypothetical protein VE954_24710 [Oligoflexus sp.]|uniref:hypothetical protein n=1 Tax=Oligoflexus sp. TaxID=1971216 RepID=UPI002D2FA3B8|nr:hypothetical protein [Oligoflexus sp.]HYX36319.1 hypothetical protein [Oligoflexus sp.]
MKSLLKAFVPFFLVLAFGFSLANCGSSREGESSDLSRFVSYANVNGAKLILWSIEKKDPAGRAIIDQYGYKSRCIYYKEGSAAMSDSQLMKTSVLLTPGYLSDGYVLNQLQRQKLSAFKAAAGKSLNVPASCSLDVLLKANFSGCITTLLDFRRRARDFGAAEEAQILILQDRLMMGTPQPVQEEIVRQSVQAIKTAKIHASDQACPDVTKVLR